MRVAGLNPWAVLAAAVGIYAIGFLIYGVIFSAQWMALSGFSQEDFKGQEWRMALSPLMPILIAVGLGFVIKWRGAAGAFPGAVTGAIAGLFFLVAGRLYGFAYGIEPAGLLYIDALHLLLNGVVGGAILGAMTRPAA